MSIKVLYEDNHLIAVFKPAGILSQGDKSGDLSMFDMVKDYIRIKKGKGSVLGTGNARHIVSRQGGTTTGVFLGLLHRLDRPVSGIMLFAKTSKGASRLSEQFRNHEVEKTYHAIVIGKPKESRGVLINNLIKDEKLKKAKPAFAKRFGETKESRLYYEVVKSGADYSLIKIRLETGKFHQIRLQFSLAGFPILGDVKYGAKSPLPDKSVALCATGLSFYCATEHPAGKTLSSNGASKKVDLSISIPESWQKYI